MNSGQECDENKEPQIVASLYVKKKEIKRKLLSFVYSVFESPDETTHWWRCWISKKRHILVFFSSSTPYKMLNPKPFFFNKRKIENVFCTCSKCYSHWIDNIILQRHHESRGRRLNETISKRVFDGLFLFDWYR